MTDDIAEGAAFRIQHFHAPFRFGRQIDQIGNGRFRRCRQAVFNVFVALTQNLQIGSQYQSRTFGILRTLNQVLHKLAVAHHIKLKPKRRTGIFSYIFNRTNGHGRQRKRNTEFFCRPCCQDFTVGVRHARETGRCNRYRHFHILTDHFGLKAASFHINQYFLTETDVFKIRSIFTISGFRPRAWVNIIIKHTRHFTFGDKAQVFDTGYFA